MPADTMSRPRRGFVLAACMMATFTAAVEGTIVATAMPTIVAELRGADLYSWVFSAFLLTQAVTIPIYGRLADLYGRKRIFLIGSGLFLIGSALCGLANDITTLIVFRAVQGCGAGAVQPIAYTIVGDIYTPVERARIQGMLSAVFGVAAFSGPVMGSLLVHAGSWRFVFWINMPIVVAAMAMVSFFLRADVPPRRHRIDFGGAILLIAGIACVVIAADRWRQIGWTNVLLALVIGTASLIALVLHERSTQEPMLPASLWRNRIIIVGGLGALTVGVTIMSVTAFIPPFLQAAMGRTAGTAGMVLGVLIVVWMLGSIVGGRLMVYLSYRTTGCAGAIMIMLGAALLLALTSESPIGQVIAGVSVLAFGLGFCNTTWIVSVQTQVSFEQRGSATSAIMFMRFLGQALGAAIGGVILSLGFQFAAPEVAGALGALLEHRSAGLSGVNVADLTEAASRAFRGVFVMTAVMGLTTLVLASRLPRGVSASSTARSTT
jgi:EmrB/QacA subfamily drug resistance transporter